MTPADATRYTHGHGAAVLASHRTRTAEDSAAHLLPHLRPGLRLLDVGSGAGTITADLARIVGPSCVTALEVDEAAADLTRAELARQGLSAVTVVVGDAEDLPLAAGAVDVVHAHQVLQHVARPVTALAEFRRVAWEGGLVAVRDSDYEGFRWFPEDPRLDRWRAAYCAVARGNGGHPDAGRRLLAWAHAAGFTEVTATSSTWCHADPTSRGAWSATWSGRLREGPFAERLEATGHAGASEREHLAAAFEEWAAHPDAWFSVLHGEIVARA